MDRLTARIDGYSHGKCGRNLDIALKNKSYNRGCFECTAIIERLCEYEDTGLTPEEITAMKAEYSDTFQAHLNELLGIKDKRIAELESDNARLRKTMDKMCGLWGENNAN